MTGRQIFEKITYDPCFVFDKAVVFTREGSLPLNTWEEAKEFLVLYTVLLKTKDKPYDEKQMLQDYEEAKSDLKEKGYIEFGPKKYSIEKNTCTAS